MLTLLFPRIKKEKQKLNNWNNEKNIDKKNV